VSLAQDVRRFAPLTADELTPEQKKWADAITEPPRSVSIFIPPFQAWVRDPELATRLTPLGDYLRFNSSLPPRLSEFAILITARHWDAPYIWCSHYPRAISGGLAASTAADLAAGKRPSGMKDDEAALFDLGTQIYRDKSLSDAAFQAAQAQFGERGIMDIIGLMGYYDITAMTLITMHAAPQANCSMLLPPLPH